MEMSFECHLSANQDSTTNAFSTQSYYCVHVQLQNHLKFRFPCHVMQCKRHQLEIFVLLSILRHYTTLENIYMYMQLRLSSVYIPGYITCMGVHHGNNVVIIVKAPEPNTVHTSLSEFIFALKCGLLSIFRATSNLSSSTPDTIFCQSLMHRSFRVVKRSNTSPTVCLQNTQLILCYGPSMRQEWLDTEVKFVEWCADHIFIILSSHAKKNEASFQAMQAPWPNKLVSRGFTIRAGKKWLEIHLHTCKILFMPSGTYKYCKASILCLIDTDNWFPYVDTSATYLLLHIFISKFLNICQCLLKNITEYFLKRKQPMKSEQWISGLNIYSGAGKNIRRKNCYLSNNSITPAKGWLTPIDQDYFPCWLLWYYNNMKLLPTKLTFKCNWEHFIL